MNKVTCAAHKYCCTFISNEVVIVNSSIIYKETLEKEKLIFKITSNLCFKAKPEISESRQSDKCLTEDFCFSTRLYNGVKKGRSHFSLFVHYSVL